MFDEHLIFDRTKPDLPPQICSSQASHFSQWYLHLVALAKAPGALPSIQIFIPLPYTGSMCVADAGFLPGPVVHPDWRKPMGTFHLSGHRPIRVSLGDFIWENGEGDIPLVSY